ncbi:putative ABC transporter ATP-binding protein [Corynebacterium capitovis DSM 44611]|uniref:metal ABC transporter ATP-binding protein n=1 Tax=Corynebacterium capitovis TaxID=131081 RepID=UPI000360E1A3|nr:metal ABC transporter ATP-binding protein [Corynebacterium capitovis]WKD58131.1 putative ABC transporter ATP-binding protein [Corynebacterium capitovis DSM 44611]
MTARLIDAAVTPLFSDLNLELGPGEIVAILGPNGAGKSTLLHTILGTRRLTSGRVEVSGRVGFIPQQRMFPDVPCRVRDLVSLSLAHGIVKGRRARREDVEKLLAYVGAEHLADQRVGTLSGGQQQLVRQAQAFANQPEVLLADEPFLSLDVARQRDTVKRISECGASVLIVTHSIDPVADVVDRILYLGPRGHVLGTCGDVMRSDVLSDLYGTTVDVVTVRGKTVVI